MDGDGIDRDQVKCGQPWRPDQLVETISKPKDIRLRKETAKSNDQKSQNAQLPKP